MQLSVLLSWVTGIPSLAAREYRPRPVTTHCWLVVELIKPGEVARNAEPRASLIAVDENFVSSLREREVSSGAQGAEAFAKILETHVFPITTCKAAKA